MSRRKDTDYLSISARIRAMENRLLTRERMDRIIDARDHAEAMKGLAECGYPDGSSLEGVLTQARADTFRDMAAAAPDPQMVEIFQLKYDYHNAKVMLKAKAVGAQAGRLMLSGGRYQPERLLESWGKEGLHDCAEPFAVAVAHAEEILEQTGDPQQADLVLDRACYQEMATLARALDSEFLQGFVSLSVDVANLRTAVRVHRMDRGPDFLRQVLLPGGTVAEQTIAAARSDALAEVFRVGPLAKAAELGSELARPQGGQLTEFERMCDDAVTAYLATARRVPFGEQALIGYLYAKEAEITAVRTIFAGRAAGLDGQTIRSRLRETYV